MWVEPNSFSKIADRLVEVAFLLVRKTSIGVGKDKIWI